MKRLFFSIGMIFLCASISAAQLLPVLGSQRAGISSLQFLKIGVGARATGMADAFVAIGSDVTTLYWNPAGIVQFTEHQIMFAHTAWFVDMKHDYFGMVYHFSSTDAIGVSVISMRTDDIPITTETQPLGTGEYFSYGDLAVGLTYGRKLTNQFAVGASVKFVQETLAQLTMRAVLIDLGTFYWTGLGTTRFAVSLTNFGNEVAPTGEVNLYSGNKKNDWQAFSPPTVFRMGFALEPYQDELHRLTTSVQLNHPNDNAENIGMGVEYGYSEKFFGRIGYKLNADEQNFTFGVGLNAPLSIANLHADYAYQTFIKLGAVHRVSLSIGY